MVSQDLQRFDIRRQAPNKPFEEGDLDLQVPDQFGAPAAANLAVVQHMIRLIVDSVTFMSSAFGGGNG